MVLTKKFSEFSDNTTPLVDDQVVGLSNGANMRTPKVLEWTTTTRPVPPFDGILGYNTTLREYEFYNSALTMWVQLESSNSGFNWIEVTGVSFNAVPNMGFVTNRAATPVSIVLPATMLLGDAVAVMGKGTGGWSLVCNAGQVIQFGSVATSVAGSISSDIQYANIEVRCITPDLVWEVWSVNSNPTYL